MSKFYGYFFPELSHWFGVNAVQRLEKKIGHNSLWNLEYELQSLLNRHEQQRKRGEAISQLLNVYESKKY